MKYLIVGAGAVGCLLAVALTEAGADVTLLTRGQKTSQIGENGVQVKLLDGSSRTVRVKVAAEESYDDRPDVIVVCVKHYALDSVYPLLDRVSTPETVVLSVLNALNIADQIDRRLSQPVRAVQGLAYVGARVESAGVVVKESDFFNIVVGLRAGEEEPPLLEHVLEDLRLGGVDATRTDDILQASLIKFVRVSTLSGAEVLFETDLGGLRENPEAWAFYESLGREIEQIAEAVGTPFEGDPVSRDLQMMWDAPSSTYRTSLVHDHINGRKTEFVAQFVDVYELGRAHGLPMTAYEAVCRKMGHPLSGSEVEQPQPSA
jgi:2-dehydropantoate 2-reductase